MVFAGVDWGELGKVIWSALLAGVLVPTLFALLLYGSTRSGESRREKDGPAATLFAGIAVVAGVLFVAAIAFALTIILKK